MSAHLLPVTVAWLARLPSGVALSDPDRGYLGRTIVDGVGHVYLIDAGSSADRVVRGPMWLDMSDTLTAAAVAARIVRPWLMEQGSRSGREFGDVEALAEHHGSLSAALLMEPLTPADLDTLTRLARAAMEGA